VTSLSAVAEYLRAEAADACATGGVAGYLAGVYHAGEQTVVAQGLANTVTRAPMREDTGYLVGSITKVLTTTLLMRYVERGQVDLDERVVTYLPEFRLARPAKTEELRVSNLVTHTDGIDADVFFPDRVRGRGALTGYVAELGRCSTLFDPGEFISYSNPAFMVAGRLLEVVTGVPFHDLLRREIYDTAGMVDSCSSAQKAILRNTAVGHFLDPESGVLRRTDMFMLPESWSACGSTPIVTIADLLAFARAHLANGLASTGRRLLAEETAQRMRETTHDMRTPNVPPIGLGWWLPPFGETTVLWHGGGSPGGTAMLAVVPEHNLAFAAFGNTPSAALVHDRLLLWLLREHLALDVPDLDVTPIDIDDLSLFTGTYRSHQLRIDVRAVDGQLEEIYTLEPIDKTQAQILHNFSGGQYPQPPRRLVPIGVGLFAPTGAAPGAFAGIGRTTLVSFHGYEDGGDVYRSSGARLPRRVAS
jgi:CubicO group peptidase (beta-lactamase class C family)